MTENQENKNMEPPKVKGNAIIAFVLAWLIPGAGHLYIGKKVRGIIILITLTGIFWMGMALGGVNTVDPRAERWWFLADMGAGLNGLAGWGMHQRLYNKINEEITAGPLQESYRQINKDIQDLANEEGRLAREIKSLADQARLTGDPSRRSSLQSEIRRLDAKARQIRMDRLMRIQRLKTLQNEFIDKEMVREGVALVPPTSTVARAYTGIAGLMNLMCVFDAGLLAMIAAAKKKEEKE